MAGEGEVRIAWWNTSLFPPGCDKGPSKGRVETATRVVHHLLVAEGVDVLALGEVTRPLVDDLRERVGDEAYEAIADDRAAPRSDVGAIYNARRLRHVERAFVGAPRGSQPGSVTDAVLNVALRLVLQPHDAPTPFQLLALHWLSRRRTHHRAERVRCAETLRALMTDAGSHPSVGVFSRVMKKAEASPSGG